MNRKPWIIAGIIITVLLIAGVGITLLRGNNPNTPVSAGQTAPVSILAYCGEEQVKPCVVSFSIDADENMLINLLLPDLSYPNFQLTVVRGKGEINYKCQRTSTAINNAYCTGEKIPPGEIVHMMLISTGDGTLLAEGNLSIIGLAFPTVGVAEATPTGSTTASPTQLQTPRTSTPAQTPTRSTFPTQTQPSYPNPSYPNPSYP